MVCVCVCLVFLEQGSGSALWEQIMRRVPKMGETMPANLSHFIICWSWAAEIPNTRLSGLHLVRDRLHFSSPASCLLIQPVSKECLKKAYYLFQVQ